MLKKLHECNSHLPITYTLENIDQYDAVIVHSKYSVESFN